LNKKIFIINGSGGVGKTTFVELISECLNDIMKQFHTVINFSSVDKVKKIAKEIGWDGSKTEKDRKFLSDLKVLCSEYCDMPFKSMKTKVKEFQKKDRCYFLFLHIREPEEISRAVKEFDAKTILITRNSVKPITSNMADANVFNYEYDYVISNDGTIEELRSKARDFVECNWEE
jgi:predicted ATP-binding protein involved in virulence